MLRLRTVDKKSQELSRLLELRERLALKTASARVISKDTSPYFRVASIRLDRGERDTIRPGMPVISDRGLVGRISRTAGRTSDVLLTVDRKSSIEIIVPRTGARGALRGGGDSDRYEASIERLHATDEVSVGAPVYTSGFGKHFPPSILVGYITAVKQQENKLQQRVTVRPAVDFSALDTVLVVTSLAHAGDEE